MTPHALIHWGATYPSAATSRAPLKRDAHGWLVLVAGDSGRNAWRRVLLEPVTGHFILVDNARIIVTLKHR